MSSMELIKKLREETGAGVMDAKKALDACNDDYALAVKYVLDNSINKAMKKSDRTAVEGVVASYIHTGSKMGSLVHLSCETDFVAKTEDFLSLANEIAKQVCAIKYSSVEEVLADTYIKDPSVKLSDLINQQIAKLGEKIELVKFVRYSVKELDD